ncbi:MAG: DNA-directed RNA polymerase subunit alpha [Bacteroidetes bacterium]|nr:DNA-directed RNA polymerase subunit alpha [Bacteroidota bacterium]
MSVLSFQMPQKVIIDLIDENHGIFVFEPLEKGYGVTIGNALRRVLLSSLDGYAITSVKVPGILHEFSSMEGIVEDMVEVILNLKRVRFKKISDNEENKISFKVEGKDRVVAEDITKSSSFLEVLNPDLVICNLAKSAKLEMEITIAKGRSYIPAEENKNDTDEIGVIAIDSIYTPVRNVKYEVENTRVEQRIDYEKLTMEVETDGSVDPESAMRDATDILMKHFALLSTKGISFEPMADNIEDEIMDDETLRIRKLLQTPISRLSLSVRASNCLKAANVSTLGELAKLKISDMLKFRNLGKKSLSELQELMEEKGLKFGMDLNKYKLEETV